MVLLDIMLPGMDGMEVCRRLKGAPTTADIPIIMLTAKGKKWTRFWAWSSALMTILPSRFLCEN